MRILIVTPEFPPHAGGGILKYYDLLADSLVKIGATVSVLVATPFSAFDDYVTRSGVSVTFVPLAEVNRHAERLSHLAAAPNYRRYIAAGLAAADRIQQLGDAFDIIETTDFGLLFAPLVAMTSRPPVLVKMHGSVGQIADHEPVEARAALDVALARLTEAVLLPSADSIVAYSPANASEWSSRLGIPVGFLPAPLNVRASAAPQPTGFSGLVAARIQTWKGPQLLCDALVSLGADVPGELRIAWAGRDTSTAPGGGSLERWLANAYPGIWGTHVVPIGQKPQDEIQALQQSVRFVVVPSHWDTFNYTVAESMAVGCVTVASTGAGASYLIEPGVNGYRFTAGDAAALGEQLLRAHLNTSDERRRIGDAARRTIATELNPEKVAHAAIEQMAGVTQKPSPERPLPWVRGFMADAQSPVGHDDAHLENVGMKTLARHLGRRLVRRLTSSQP